MDASENLEIEDVARLWLETKRNSMQALADRLGITRQALNAKVKKFLRENPEFETAPRRRKRSA